MSATAHLLKGQHTRLHLQHGPIDLIIGIDSDEPRQKRGFGAATARFETVLSELVSELEFLKSPAHPNMKIPQGSVAKRMVEAVRPLSAWRFITPMAAVAGSVADEILSFILLEYSENERPNRIYVNNGGDIAFHLSEDATFTAKIDREDRLNLGFMTIEVSSPSRGLATSGRGGRSLSMGIADSVTVLAQTAAQADAAATLIGNAVNLPGHPAIRRARACDLVDDSDLGGRWVVTGCSQLSSAEAKNALEAGMTEAALLADNGKIEKAALFLQNSARLFVREHTEIHHLKMQAPLEYAHYA